MYEASFSNTGHSWQLETWRSYAPALAECLERESSRYNTESSDDDRTQQLPYSQRWRRSNRGTEWMDWQSQENTAARFLSSRQGYAPGRLHREGLPAGFSAAWSDLTAGLCLGRRAARLWAPRMQQVAFRDLTASCRQVRKTPDVSKNCVTGTDKRIFKTRPGIVGVFTMQSRKCLNSLTQSFCFQSEWESPWIKADMVHGNKP